MARASTVKGELYKSAETCQNLLVCENLHCVLQFNHGDMQGEAIASQVTHLRASAHAGAAELEDLIQQHDEDKATVDILQQKLADAEEEIEVLRLQAERAAILEVQSEISSRLVEDLQVSSPWNGMICVAPQIFLQCHSYTACEHHTSAACALMTSACLFSSHPDLHFVSGVE